MKSKDLSEIEVDNLNEKMSQWFIRFAGQCSGSKLYEQLSLSIAADSTLLAIAAQGNHSQPIPNLFLAAVHFLILKNKTEPLAAFYPSAGGRFEASSEFFRAFRDFVFKFSPEIIYLIKNRTVQTNQVRRCAQLMAGLSLISEHIENSPLTLIDVGTSSGLNLLMDQYRYFYNDVSVGKPDSELVISCQINGDLFPNIKVPQIDRRIGLANPEESLWAKALIWPDQSERLERLEGAIAIRKKHDFDMRKTIGNEVLENLLLTIDSHTEICVMHSFTLNQFSELQRNEFQEVIRKSSAGKTIWRMSLEWIGTTEPELKIQKFTNGILIVDVSVAKCHGHGEWIEFNRISLS